MKKCILFFFNLYSLSFANIYEKLNDFAYKKNRIKILRFKKLN